MGQWDSGTPKGLPDQVYQRLPPMVKDACSQFSDPTEKEVFLIGALGVLSGLMPNYEGFYNGDKVGAELFVYVLAAYGEGKGKLKLARQLGTEVHAAKRKRTESEEAEFKKLMTEYRRAKDRKGEEPKRPAKELLFIPANSSKTGIMELMADNNGRGIIFETEGDTLADTLRQDYANFSDLLRKAFHHEFLSYYRRTEKEFNEIDRPHLAVVLSSTFDQLFGLIPSIHNGLYSRFLYYIVPACSDFKDVFAKEKEGHSLYFQQVATRLNRKHEVLSELPYPVLFTLTSEQQQAFLTYFMKEKSEVNEYANGELNGTVNRLGLICFRVAMVLSMIRAWDYPEIPTTITCNDTDFENALCIVQVLLDHAEHVYKMLPKKPAYSFNAGNKAALKETAIQLAGKGYSLRQIAKETGLPKTTVERYLK